MAGENQLDRAVLALLDENIAAATKANEVHTILADHSIHSSVDRLSIVANPFGGYGSKVLLEGQKDMQALAGLVSSVMTAAMPHLTKSSSKCS